MIVFVSWPKAQDKSFRAAYAQAVGEEIQEEVPETLDGKYCVGSSRIKQEHMDALAADFPLAAFSEEPPPTKKEEDA